MTSKILVLCAFVCLGVVACKPKTETASGDQAATAQLDSLKMADSTLAFAPSSQVVVDKFADLQLLQYEVTNFDKLDLKKRTLIYYLAQASLSGRDILYDQNYRHNLSIRRTLEAIAANYSGDKTSVDYAQFLVYAKRVWFSNGIHHHYSYKKMIPACSQAYFAELIAKTPAGLPLAQGQTVADFTKFILPLVFDPKIDAKRVAKDAGMDVIAGSANNYYSKDITQKEVENYYEKLKNKADTTPVMQGLNSKLVKENGKLVEKVWKVGGMYGAAIEKIVYWLEKAVLVAENNEQKAALELLVKFYKTGDLKTFDEYNIAWVKDVNSDVDISNGFIEVYGDALGYRAAYESVLSFRDVAASKRISAIGAEAQWFEDNSPLMPAHKKKKVKGIAAKVITVALESGDAAPATPIGINLPNSNWIRQTYGSKSVSLDNIVNAYNKASSGSVMQEFGYNQAEIDRAKAHGELSGKLHTDMHEVIGHASGQINPGVGEPNLTLKTYASTLEEARADLVALYYLMDKKLVDMGLMPSLETGKASYDYYIRNGMMLQLRRLTLGDNLEEDHMRNRQLIASWAYEKGKKDNVIERKTMNGKTFFVVNDYEKLRVLFGELLREIQRLKSEGDYAAAKALVENYGVKVDKVLHKEVLERYAKLNTAPYNGFVQPTYLAIKNEKGEITDVKVAYTRNFLGQMLNYGKNYSFLPNQN